APAAHFFWPGGVEGETGAAVYQDRRPRGDCTAGGNQGPPVSELLAASNDPGSPAISPRRRTVMKPETVGMSSARLARLDEVMKRRYVDGVYLPGMLTHVYRKGPVVHTGICRHI